MRKEPLERRPDDEKLKSRTRLPDDVLLVEAPDVDSLEDPRREVLKTWDDGKEALYVDTLVVKEIEGTAKANVSAAILGVLVFPSTHLRRCPSSLTSKPSRFQCWGGRVKSSIRAIPESRSPLVLVSCAHRSSETTPTSLPFAVNRKSALSDRRETRYSLLEVNMRSVSGATSARSETRTKARVARKGK